MEYSKRLHPVTNKTPGMGTRIAKARLSMGLTQEKLSELLPVSKSTVSAWEKDNTKAPSDELLLLLANMLKCTREYLKFGVGDEVTRFACSRNELLSSAGEIVILVYRDFSEKTRSAKVETNGKDVFLNLSDSYIPYEDDGNILVFKEDAFLNIEKRKVNRLSSSQVRSRSKVYVKHYKDATLSGWYEVKQDMLIKGKSQSILSLDYLNYDYSCYVNEPLNNI